MVASNFILLLSIQPEKNKCTKNWSLLYYFKSYKKELLCWLTALKQKSQALYWVEREEKK